MCQDTFNSLMNSLLIFIYILNIFEQKCRQVMNNYKKVFIYYFAFKKSQKLSLFLLTGCNVSNNGEITIDKKILVNAMKTQKIKFNIILKIHSSYKISYTCRYFA